MSSVYRVVLDTNVLFEGLTRQKGTCGLIIDAWLAGLIRVYVSDALAFEYVDVLSRKLSPAKWQQARVALRTLLAKADFIQIYYSWRPASPDPDDDLVIDCAMDANAWLITATIKDFRAAQADLGLQVITPLEFIGVLAK